MPWGSFYPAIASVIDLSRPPGEVAEARSAEDVFDLSRPFVTRVYRRRFRLTTLYQQCGAGLVREAAKAYFGVAIGQPYAIGVPGDVFYESDPFSFATRITCTQGPDPCEWYIDVNYEPIDPATLEAWDHPLYAPPDFEQDGVKYQRVCEYDMDETALAAHSYQYGNPILNSANDPYDPTVKADATRSVLTYRRNEALDPRQAVSGVVFDPLFPETYRDTINKTTFLGRAPRTVKVEDIKYRRVWHPILYDPTASPPLTGYYAEVTYVFAIKVDTWDEWVLDAGYRTLDWTSPPYNRQPIIINGAPATAPVPLDGYGQIAPRDGVTDQIDPYFKRWQIYREFDLASILKIT